MFLLQHTYILVYSTRPNAVPLFKKRQVSYLSIYIVLPQPLLLSQLRMVRQYVVCTYMQYTCKMNNVQLLEFTCLVQYIQMKKICFWSRIVRYSYLPLNFYGLGVLIKDQIKISAGTNKVRRGGSIQYYIHGCKSGASRALFSQRFTGSKFEVWICSSTNQKSKV